MTLIDKLGVVGALSVKAFEIEALYAELKKQEANKNNKALEILRKALKFENAVFDEWRKLRPEMSEDDIKKVWEN